MIMKQGNTLNEVYQWSVFMLIDEEMALFQIPKIQFLSMPKVKTDHIIIDKSV